MSEDSRPPDSFDELLRKSLPGLRAYIRWRTLGRSLPMESVDDYVQSTCREVLLDVGDVRPRDADELGRWLRLAADRKLVDRLRYHRRSKRRTAGQPDPRPPAEHPAAATTPSGAAARRESLEALGVWLRELPGEYERVLRMRYLEGRSRTEIAAAIGRSEAAVRMLLVRARARLAQVAERSGP